jgi:hypothetical protein
MADTGKKLWEVDFDGSPITFNVIAKDATEAENKARTCYGEKPGSDPALVEQAQTRSVRFNGTLDEPRRRRKAVK